MDYFKFNKEADGRWYVDLPNWSGPKEDLEMVSGADTMLDILAQGDGSVELAISRSAFDGFRFELAFSHEEGGGAWYSLSSDHHNFDVWLCHVTLFVYGGFPVKLFIS